MHGIFCTMRVRCAILLSVCFATHLGSVGRALAQEEDACSAVTGELKGVQRALEQARSELAQAAGVAAELVIVRQALSTIERELARAKTEHLACEERHDALCQGTRSFTHSLSIGKVDTSSAAACIDPGDRRAIVEQLAGWTNVSKALARL